MTRSEMRDSIRMRAGLRCASSGLRMPDPKDGPARNLSSRHSGARAFASEPGIHNHRRAYGFRAFPFGPSRNDDGKHRSLREAHNWPVILRGSRTRVRSRLRMTHPRLMQGCRKRKQKRRRISAALELTYSSNRGELTPARPPCRQARPAPPRGARSARDRASTTHSRGRCCCRTRPTPDRRHARRRCRP